MPCTFDLNTGETLYFDDKSQAIEFLLENPEYQSQLIASTASNYNGSILSAPNTENLGKIINQTEAVRLFKTLLPEANTRDLVFLSSMSDKGRYYKGIIELQSTGNINENVLRHEVFHKIFSEYLTEDERQSYLKIAKEKWPTANETIAEELLARDFQTYRNNPESLGVRVARIFRKIFRFLKLVRTTPTDVLNDLYSKINKGKYKNTSSDSLRDTSVKNYGSIINDFGSTEAYKKASNTLDIDIYNKSKLEHADELKSSNIKSVLSNTLGKKDAILALPDLYKERIESLKQKLTLDSVDDAQKLGIVDLIDNLELVLKNYKKLTQELYPQEYKAVKDDLKRILGDYSTTKEEDVENAIGISFNMSEDEKIVEDVLNHEEVKQFPEIKEDPEALENEFVTDGFNREDSGTTFSNEIQDNNSKDNETNINDDVKWFLSHIPKADGSGFYRFRNVFPVAIDIIRNLNFNASLSNQNPLNFSRGRKLNTAVALEISKLFEYIDPSLTDQLNPNYTFIDGRFVAYQKALDGNKIVSKKLIEGLEPFHINNAWKDLRIGEDIKFIKKPNDVHTIGQYIDYLANETGESPINIYRAYMQQESKQILAGIVQSLGSYRSRKLYNPIKREEDGKTVVRNRINTPIDASAKYRAEMVASIINNLASNLNLKQLEHLASDKATIGELASYVGINAEFIKNNLENSDDTLIKHLSIVFKNTLIPFYYELQDSKVDNIDKEQDVTAKLKGSLYNDNAIVGLAETIAAIKGEYTASSVLDAEGKNKYLYVHSSNAYDVLDALRQPDLGYKDIASLESTKYVENPFDYLTKTEETIYNEESKSNETHKTFYSFNPFIHNMSQYKIYNVLDSDGIIDKTVGDGRVIEYSKEKEPDYVLRTFVSGFLNNLANKSDAKYIQFLYTNSNRPTPLATEINLQSEESIDGSIKKAIDQLINKTKLKHLKDTIDSYNKNPFLNMNAFELGLQRHFNTKLTGEKLLALLDDSNKYSAIASIKDAIVSSDLDYIKSLIINNKLPLEDNLNKAITKIKSVNPKLDLEHVSSDFKYTEWRDGKPLYNYPSVADKVIKQFLLNNYVNNLFINQLIIGDNTIYGDANGVVKRMSIATAPGQKGFSNPLNGVPKEVDFLVAEDDVQEVLDEIFKGSKVEGIVYEATDAQMWFTDRFDSMLKNMYGRKYGFSLINKPVYHKTDSQGITRTIKTSGLNLGMNEAAHLGTNTNLRELNNILNSHGIMGIIPKSANKSGGNTTKLELETRPWTQEEFDSLSDGLKAYLNSEGVSTVDYKTLMNSKGRDFNSELLTFRNSLKTGKFKIQARTEDNKDAYNASKFKLDTRFLRMQLNPSHDLNMNTTNPSQLQSFLGVLVKEGTEKYVNNIYSDYSNLFKIYRRELIQSMQTDNQFDSDKIKELVKDTLQSKGSERLADVISYIGIDHPSIYKKVQTQLSSIIEKRGITTKFNGGKFTLISSHLFFNPNTGSRLRFIEDSKTGKRHAEVLAPAGLFDKATQDKIKKGEDVYLHSEQLAFRIPSTELHSAVILKVVGFHTSQNNSLVLPQEIVPLHGSDYDVDALFLILKEKAGLMINYSKSTIKDGKINTSLLQIPKGQPIGYTPEGKFIPGYDSVIQNQKQDEITREQFAELTSSFENKSIEKVLADPSFEKNYKTYNKASVRKNKKLDNLLKAFYKNRIMYNMLEIIQQEKARMNNPISMDILKDPSTEGSMAQYLNNLNALAQSGNLDLSSYRDNHTSYKSNMAGSALTGIMANNTKAIAVLTRAGSHNFNISYLGKELNTFSNTQTTFDTLDALVNAAIDNVKEQILFKGNISIETGNTVAAMVGLGLPMNEVFGLIAQPVIRMISNYGNSNRGKNQISDLFETRFRNLGVANTSFKEYYSNLDKNFTQEELDSAIKNLPMGVNIDVNSMSLDDLVLQQKVLDKFNEFAVIGELLRDASSSLSILREAPANYGEVKRNLNTWSSIFEKAGLTMTPVINKNNGTVIDLKAIPIEGLEEKPLLNLNTFLKSSPYIKEAIVTIYNQKVITEQSSLFNPILNSFIETFNSETGKDIGLEKPAIFSLDNTQEKHEEAIRENILKLAMSQTFIEEIKNDVIEKSSAKGYKYILRKVAAYKEITSLEAKSIKSAYSNLPASQQNNRFMNYLTVENSSKKNTNYISFRQPSNLEEADVLDIQDDFENIVNLDIPGISKERLEKFQYDLIKYSALSTGMSFGITGYSQFIPGKLLVDNANNFKIALDRITYNLNSLSLPLTMMLAKSNTTAFKTIRNRDLTLDENKKVRATSSKAELLNGNIAEYDLFVPKKGNLDISSIVNYSTNRSSEPYILLGETKDGFTYRKLFPSSSVADFDLNWTDYLNNPLKLGSAFDPRVKELFTHWADEFGLSVQVGETDNYSTGEVVTVTNSSDYFRDNSIRAVISSIDKNNSTVNLSYTKDSKDLNTSEKLDNFKKQFKVC